ncbi:MAG: bifunctional YncE family protein/alkaline phosphatase family protein [Verrucomicrobiota bacterium]
MMKKNFLSVTFSISILLLASCRTESLENGNLRNAPLPSVSVPINQVLTPAGIQVELPGMRPQVIALSPDGKLLATSGKHELILINPIDGKILQTSPLPLDDLRADDTNEVSEQILKPDPGAQASYNGLVFSRDGKRIYLSNVAGDIKVLAVGKDNKVSALHSLPLPQSKLTQRKSEIPAGLAISPDGKRLYVAGNLSNRLLELETATGKILRTFDVGVAPYEVVLVGEKVYVSNWGGRRPNAHSTTGPAGQGTTVRVDPIRHIANEGSVSVINLRNGKVEKEIVVGLHSTAMALAPNGRFIAIANSGSDTLSIIDTRRDEIVETISLHWQPKDLFGASPNALVFDKSGKQINVCNGTQNAIAVVRFNAGKSKLAGLIPTGWYPGAIALDSQLNKLCVANIKGIGSGKTFTPGEKVELNSHQYRGTLSLIPVPGKSKLAEYTKTVLDNYGAAAIQAALLPARENIEPRPVPERFGEPSVFKHVIYIIKENRTYDQVLGDMKEGNGDARLCIFGENITPNQHKLSREFVLLDNTRCSGVLSADGHQWTDSAFVSDYLEKSFAGFPRSYPYYGDDAMAYSSAGFIWDNVLAHKKTLRIYGEFTRDTAEWKDPKRKGSPGFLDCYRDLIDQTDLVEIKSRATIKSIEPYLCTNTAGFLMRVTDVFRARQFINELKEFERNGNFPNLIVMLLPSDHTSGTSPRSPTPSAKVADNDLAFGQIVEAVSHSKFWKETCIFAIEDDPQAGFDHVSSYRTTAYVVSPYTRRHAVVSTDYNQTSLVRTIELMLGLPPMNQLDASATPMFDCFTNQPNFTPYITLTNNIPLDQMNPDIKAIRDFIQKKFAIASSKLPLDAVDECPEDLFNRILWHAQKGLAEYPAWAVTAAKGDKDDD